MGCKHYQKLIKAFDEHKLSVREQEDFVTHMLSCSDCQEELEIYYIIEYGLNDDGKISYENEEYRNLIETYDFKSFVDKKLKDSREEIIREKMAHSRNVFLYLLSQVLVGITGVFYILQQLR